MRDNRDDSVPSERDVEAAVRLSKRYFFHGHEPYAPSVYAFAKILCAYRRELEHGGRDNEDEP